jgi:hypothetical protein
MRLDQGSSGNEKQQAAMFVCQASHVFHSKCMLAQAILLLYNASERRPDDAVAKLCAMKQALGMKRLVWALDMPPSFHVCSVLFTRLPHTALAVYV